jgi:threonine synthase
MGFEIRCSVCDKNPSSPLDYKCPYCGAPLSVKIQDNFDKGKIKERDYSQWRYSEYFPYVNAENVVTLGEGWTPFVKFSENIYFKLESQNPTGSFKDRGSTTLISAIYKLVKNAGGYVAEDSSGNAGASIAAYATRAELKAKIYVPDTVSGPKFNQIQFYGAETVKVTGGRNAIAQAAQEQENKKYYIGHILHPLFRDGIRSLAYEIAEQSNWRPPNRIYLPVSAGTLLIGVIEGFAHLFQSKTIPTMPTIIACQTSQVSPLYHRIKNQPYSPPATISMVTDALLGVNPPLLDLMTKELTEAKGEVAIVEEDETINSYEELAKRGFFVEPSSAVAYAAYEQHVKDDGISKKEKVAIILTGSGLKTIQKPHVIRI